MATTTATPTIVQLIATFSDYAGAIGRLHQDALTAYVDKHVELFAAVKPLVTDDKMTAPALGAVLRQQAKDAGKVWTLKDESLAVVLAFGRMHTAKRLATYSSAVIKAEGNPTIAGYRTWLSDLSKGHIDESGARTADGNKAVKERDAKAAKLAVAKPDLVTTIDYLKDMEPLSDAEQLKALLLLRANLDADIALVERKLGKSKKGQDAIKSARTAVTTARRKAADKS